MSLYAVFLADDEASTILAGLHAWVALSMNDDERDERNARSAAIAVKMLTGKRG